MGNISLAIAHGYCNTGFNLFHKFFSSIRMLVQVKSEVTSGHTSKEEKK